MCSCCLKDKYSSQPTVSAMRREEMRKNEGRELKKKARREMVMISFQRALSLRGRVESIRLFIKSEGHTERSQFLSVDLNLCLFAQQLC